MPNDKASTKIRTINKTKGIQKLFMLEIELKLNLNKEPINLKKKYKPQGDERIFKMSFLNNIFLKVDMAHVQCKIALFWFPILTGRKYK